MAELGERKDTLIRPTADDTAKPFVSLALTSAAKLHPGARQTTRRRKTVLAERLRAPEGEVWCQSFLARNSIPGT